LNAEKQVEDALNELKSTGTLQHWNWMEIKDLLNPVNKIVVSNESALSKHDNHNGDNELQAPMNQYEPTSLGVFMAMFLILISIGACVACGLFED
jgi:hypothetical protein